MAANLLVGEAVSLPGQLLDLGRPRTDADRLVDRLGPSTNKLEGGSQNGTCNTSILMVG